MTAPRMWPLAQGTFTTVSGWRTPERPNHYGVDLAAPLGTPIYAPVNGTVVEGSDRAAGTVDGFGNWVWVRADAEYGVDFIVGHVPHGSILVRKGDRVAAGQRIAAVGNEGQSSGPHAHIEFWAPNRLGGRDISPLPWLSNASYPGEKVTGMAFTPDVTMLSKADDGTRDPAKCQFICLHTNQGPETGRIESLLSYMQDGSKGVSYNMVVGADGRTGRCNDDNYIPWAAGYTANRKGLHLCALGYAEQTRAQWLDPPALLDGLAKVIAYWSKAYNIPLVPLTAADLKAGKRGVTGHFDTAQAWRETDHTDPGTFFPYDVVLDKAKKILAGTPTKPGGTVATDSQNITDIRVQLTGGSTGFPGWKQLGGRTQIDAIAALGVVVKRIADDVGVDASELAGFFDPKTKK